MLMFTIAMSPKVLLVDKEVLELLLDKLEEGAFCLCMVDGSIDERHYESCEGNIKLSELLYEAKWQNTILKK